jgi:toxin CcdB
MARFDVCRARGKPGFVVDCQADILRDLSTRLTVPLLPPSQAPVPVTRLNPKFEIFGVEHILVTQFATAVWSRNLSDPVASLADEGHQILAALDMLITGY